MYRLEICYWFLFNCITGYTVDEKSAIKHDTLYDKTFFSFYELHPVLILSRFLICLLETLFVSSPFKVLWATQCKKSLRNTCRQLSLKSDGRTDGVHKSASYAGVWRPTTLLMFLCTTFRWLLKRRNSRVRRVLLARKARWNYFKSPFVRVSIKSAIN